MEQDDDLLTALARELVTEKGIGECAAAVWKALQRETGTVKPVPEIPAVCPPDQEQELLDLLPLVAAEAPVLQPAARQTTSNQLQLAFAF